MRRLLVVSFAACVLASGCSSGNSDSVAEPGVTQSSSTTAAAEAAATSFDTNQNSNFIPIASDPEFESNGVPVLPTCDGGDVVLDAEFEGVAIRVTEDPGGEFFCIAHPADGASPPTPIQIGMGMPAIDTPTFETFFSVDALTIYQFRLPAGYPTEFAVQDEDGMPVLFARGRSVDYLVVIEINSDGQDFDPSAIVERSLVLVASDGTRTRVPFSGLGEPRATYEDFALCARQSGIDLPEPSTNSSVPLRVDAPTETFALAWEACKALFFDFGNQPDQDSPEHREDFEFQMNCLAFVGFYPGLMQQYSDPAAYDAAFGNCQLQSPGAINLVHCLNVNGLSVGIDGTPRAGPWPAEVLGPAWEACRDAYALTEFGGSFSISAQIPSEDCFVENGWLLALAWPRPFGDPTFLALNEQCRT